MAPGLHSLSRKTKKQKKTTKKLKTKKQEAPCGKVFSFSELKVMHCSDTNVPVSIVKSSLFLQTSVICFQRNKIWRSAMEEYCSTNNRHLVRPLPLLELPGIINVEAVSDKKAEANLLSACLFFCQPMIYWWASDEQRKFQLHSRRRKIIQKLCNLFLDCRSFRMRSPSFDFAEAASKEHIVVQTRPACLAPEYSRELYYSISQRGSFKEVNSLLQSFLTPIPGAVSDRDFPLFACFSLYSRIPLEIPKQQS